ncbi:MAG: hypothetical protein QXJ74_07250 [Nitrososphaera sp.]
MANQFLQRRWLDFRNGHSIYLAFVLTFVNFILITYNFAIERITFLQGVIDNTLVFAALFVVVYVPAAIAIGYYHRKKQYVIENEAWLKENWIWAWISMYQIRLIEGKVTPEETRQVKEYLDAILKAHKKDSLIGPDTEDAVRRKFPA